MRRLVFGLLILTAAACSKGGGGGPPKLASAPPGSGFAQINMAGTWQIANARVVGTNSPSATPPANGAQITMASDGILFIGTTRVTRAEIEAALGIVLAWYINQADGKTFLHGFGYDLLARGEEKFQVAIAGGAMDPNWMEVEAYTSEKPTPSDPELWLRSRYSLVRVFRSESQTGDALTGKAAIAAMTGSAR